MFKENLKWEKQQNKCDDSPSWRLCKYKDKKIALNKSPQINFSKEILYWYTN